jgi:hypothetical protein
MEYGEQWYNAIMNRLGIATDVVALLTPHSIDRPWILYEAGVAKGKIGGNVLGIVIGIPFDRAAAGPFFQFQNCPDDEDAVTGLVMQLIKRNPNANPREEAVRVQARAFRDRVSAISTERAWQPTLVQPSRGDESAVAKLFEEVKVMFRDLSSKVEAKLRESDGRSRVRYRRHFHPMVIEEILSNPDVRSSPDSEGAAWLMLGSLAADDLPWLYEVSMEIYRSIFSGDRNKIAAARHAARNTLRAIAESRPFHHLLREEDPELQAIARQLPEIFEHFLVRTEAASGSEQGASKENRQERVK